MDAGEVVNTQVLLRKCCVLCQTGEGASAGSFSLNSITVFKAHIPQAVSLGIGHGLV